MSAIHSLDVESGIFETEVESSVKNDDVKKKFQLYRCNAEVINRKYTEAKSVIDRLKEELHTSQEMEKSQRIRITSLQTRLSALEEKGRKLYEVSEKQRKNSEEIRKMDANIITISNLVEELKEKFQNVISATVKEINIVRENRELKSVVESKEAELRKLKTELESGMSKQEELVKRCERENVELRKEIEISKSQANEMKDCYDKMIETYKQQLAEYEGIVEEMERERRSILGDYEVSNIPTDKSKATITDNHQNKGVTWPDSTVTFSIEERENRTQPLTDMDSTLRKRDRTQGQSGCPEPRLCSQKTSQSYVMTSYLSRSKKPKLDFLDSSTSFTNLQQKKRLFSQNSNHFIN